MDGWGCHQFRQEIKKGSGVEQGSDKMGFRFAHVSELSAVADNAYGM